MARDDTARDFDTERSPLDEPAHRELAGAAGALRSGGAVSRALPLPADDARTSTFIRSRSDAGAAEARDV